MGRWYPLGDGSFRLSVGSGAWTLEPTPRGKYPWLLSDGAGVVQEIGPPDAEAARTMAEFWVEVSRGFSSG